MGAKTCITLWIGKGDGVEQKSAAAFSCSHYRRVFPVEFPIWYKKKLADFFFKKKLLQWEVLDERTPLKIKEFAVAKLTCSSL